MAPFILAFVTLLVGMMALLTLFRVFVHIGLKYMQSFNRRIRT